MLPELYTIVDLEKTDIVSICTPNHAHFTQAYIACQFAHVIIEKPMCGSLWECDALQDVAEKSGHRIFPVFQYRYADHSYFDDAIIIELPRDPKYWKGWRGDWETSLGGSLALHGIHALDLFVERYGRPTAVTGRLFGDPKVAVETRGLVALQYRNGRTCTLGFAADSEVGSTDDTDECPWHLGDPIMGYRNLFERISLSLAGDDLTGVPTFQDGRTSIELLTAIYKSHIIGQWVTLPILPSDQFYQGWSEVAKQWYARPEPQSVFFH